MSELRPIGDNVARLGRVRVDPLVQRARQVWSQAVGAQVAANSVPVRMAQDELVVHCSSSTWAAELAMLRVQVQSGLESALGEPAPPLRFEVGSVISEPDTASAPPPPPLAAPSEAQVATAERLAAGVADEGLRDRVREAVLLALQRTS